MTFGETLIRTTLVALGLVAAACTSRTTDLKSKGSLTVKLDTEAKRTAASVRLGFTVKLELPPADPPGYIWQISAHDWRFLKQLTDIVPPPAPTGSATVSFLAQQVGGTRVRFILVPPTAGREVNPVDFHEVVITIR